MKNSVTQVFPDDMEDSPANWATAWLLNGLLLVLGGTVLGLAFRLLDPFDNRPLYNPWTYVVVVPIALVLISTILSTLVSRFVERSLQATFLLSVLVHLCVLSYAGNLVIFSRAWPDLFDSMAEDRLRLKQQSLQARQYVKNTLSPNSGRLPDHIRYVPTESSPNQIADASTPAETINGTDVSLLENPELDYQPSDSARMLQRSQVTSPEIEPTHSNQTLSRNLLTQQAWESSFLGRMESIDTSPPSTESLPNEPTSPAAQAELTRAADPAGSSQADPSQFLGNLPEPHLGASALQRRSTSLELPKLSQETSIENVLRSTTAGGVAGPAARNSLPVVGQQPTFATSEPELEKITAATEQKRRPRPDRSTAALPFALEGEALSPQWDRTPSFSNSVAGRAPLELASDKLAGEAAANDLAGLTGTVGNIERSVGIAGPPVSTSQPVAGPSSVPFPLDDGRSSQLDSQPLIQPSSRAAASRRNGSRNSARPNDVADQNTELPESSRATGSLPSLLESNSTELSKEIPLIAALNPSSRLPARRRLDAEHDLSSRDGLRLNRSPVGASSGPSTRTAVAKPAFQQRLDRLNGESNSENDADGPQTELSIERGLEFLARYQRVDGSWRLQDFDTEVLVRSDTAATGLALLAFQGAGYTHLDSKYAKPIHRAIQFLAGHQKQDGDLYIPQDPASDQNAWLYSHAIAALALCEAYGMTQDERLRPVAQRAVDFMIAAQDGKRGGWRYRPVLGSDTSVSGWFLMALKSGELAGLSIPSETFVKLQSFLSAAQVSSLQPHLYRYNPYAPDTVEQGHGLRPTAVMTSVGLLMRLYLGWDCDRSEMLDGVAFLLEHSPQHGNSKQTLRDTYYWYYATQVVFHVGGDYWKQWNQSLYPLLIEHQETEGDYKGSWAPMQPVPDLWARYGGRLYVTTLNLLSLEVRYRHLPLYEATTPSRSTK